ncbi:MAG: helix-turn-helix transcriptional regulator [Actinobacteria bacterium]|nr:helix-turn-helix transcriptional regulator [Actinomycetota bacterium]
MLGKRYEGQDCTIARSLDAIGERWTLLIVRDAFYGVQRFNDFQAHLDIPRAVLSERLSGLVEHGLLVRRPDPDHAGRHRYELTVDGRALWPALHALLVWGRRRSPTGDIRAFQHAPCGTTLDDLGACPSCGTTPEPEDVVVVALRPSQRDDPVTRALRTPHRLLEPLAT